ncbi:MAG: helix-turn-helix transcriptional regulator [Lachnospiraceae bacterium]|nr:helix-turn-helix transcriptional regulator [Lachnospiraceae bacterium]
MRLKELRIMNGISQEKLAEDLGVDSRTIRRWEKDIPTTETILTLANYFGVPFFDLLSQNESMPNYSKRKVIRYKISLQYGGFHFLDNSSVLL